MILSVSQYGLQEVRMGTPTEDLEQRRAVLREELAHVGDFRLGSLVYRYRRCGKPGCPCADPAHPGHGGWVISKKVAGKTVMSTVPREELLPVIRQQLDEGRRFRRLAEAFAETTDELSRRRLSEAEAKATATKRGASRKSLKPRSPKRSND